MNAIYRGHRTRVVDEFGGVPGNPFGGVVLDTGEQVAYGDPDYIADPTWDAWFGAHDPRFRRVATSDTARCEVCWRLHNGVFVQ